MEVRQWGTPNKSLDCYALYYNREISIIKLQFETSYTRFCQNVMENNIV